ncbi:MAG TPA: hypothetical protein DCE42_04385 [Myxococcales bacterium]|nr:hypothetical protein [Deltaproteobacteria bacterium]MBU51397.1 hypothetical protein [Deltaproteobacteria bacterium]HAA53965.1 hypothetical protein [Myxococcales bacterium]
MRNAGAVIKSWQKAPEILSFSTRLSLLVLFLFAHPLVAHATPILDAKKRLRLARIYAPEIHQDSIEKYGISSIAHFLKHSTLRASVRRCGLRLKRKHTYRIGPGALLLLHDRVRFSLFGRCQYNFSLFRTTKERKNNVVYQPASTSLYLQLDDHKPKTLNLLKKGERGTIPEVNFRAYSIQQNVCVKKRWFRCQKWKTKRFFIIQYFVHLAFNEACNQHEGEHEGMVVVLDANKFEQASDKASYKAAIEKMGFYGHYKTTIVKPSEVTFRETHPIAYMGAGGHALYHKPGSAEMLKSFPFEMRPWVKRICTKRKRGAFLQEHHRGGGRIYRTWEPVPHVNVQQALSILPSKPPIWHAAFPWKILPDQQLPSGTPTSSLFQPSQPSLKKARRWLKQLVPIHNICLQSRSKIGVRLCDVQGNKHTDPCCFRQLHDGFVKWVQFTGRWGRKESFASGLTGSLAAGLGRVMKRYPLGRSLGNSGPFGPRFIHQTTWNWYPVTKKPKPTPPTWR